METTLTPLQQLVSDYEEESMRQVEKERLRKEYIEELKKRHEEEKAQFVKSLLNITTSQKPSSHSKYNRELARRRRRRHLSKGLLT
jgi:hypothetical protein